MHPSKRNSLVALLGLMRWQNLLIVAATQYFLHGFLIKPKLLKSGLTPTLDDFHFLLLVLNTVLAATGGYIINDWMDSGADSINKPRKLYIGKDISRKTAIKLYVIINLAGTGLATYLAFHIGKPHLSWLFPFSVILLYLYSGLLKKMPLAGNVLIALFCAGTAGLVWLADYEKMHLLAASAREKTQRVFIFFLLFAFFITLVREIIKDAEDVAGDLVQGLKTIPLVFGMQVAAKIAAILTVITGLIGVRFSYDLLKEKNYIALVFAVTAVLLPLTVLAYRSWIAQEKRDFSALSTYFKWLMLSGLLLLLFC